MIRQIRVLTGSRNEAAIPKKYHFHYDKMILLCLLETTKSPAINLK
jgi:hypothetical protein